MCYDCLSILDSIIDDKSIEKLKNYFLSLTPNNRDLITVTKIAHFLGVEYEIAVQIILKCEDENILKRHFSLKCPECGALIKELSEPDLDRVNIEECYCCGKAISISENDIVILFELIQIELPFECGQQDGQYIVNEASNVAPNDTFNSFVVLCDALDRRLQEERLEKYEEKRNNAKKKEIHNKAVKKAGRNRLIKIFLYIIILFVVIYLIISTYQQFGGAKITIVTSVIGIGITIFCGYIMNELFITDIPRIENIIEATVKE